MYFFRISMADQAYELFNNLIAEPAITIAPNVENIRQKQKNKNEKKNKIERLIKPFFLLNGREKNEIKS